MDKAALLFGINHYETSTNLSGCVNDAKSMAEVLQTNETDNDSRNFDCRVYTSNIYHEMDKDFIWEKIEKLFNRNIDVALLFFAGHGKEVEGEGYLVPAIGENTLEDYIPFKKIVKAAEDSPTKHIFIILDCCYSGAFANDERVKDIAFDVASLREGVCILSACDEEESSAEQLGRGLFSELLINGLKGEAADLLGNVTMASLYAYADQLLNNWQQRPEFKAHIEKRIILRKTSPRIPLAELKMLPDLFKTLGHEYPLDPTYEFTNKEIALEENVKVFKILQRMRGVYLVEPTQDEHMYYAAMNSHTCRMTTLGKFYWRMIKKGMIR